jgi:hypothetical protein
MLTWVKNKFGKRETQQKTQQKTPQETILDDLEDSNTPEEVISRLQNINTQLTKFIDKPDILETKTDWSNFRWSLIKIQNKLMKNKGLSLSECHPECYNNIYVTIEKGIKSREETAEETAAEKAKKEQPWEERQFDKSEQRNLNRFGGGRKRKKRKTRRRKTKKKKRIRKKRTKRTKRRRKSRRRRHR